MKKILKSFVIIALSIYVLANCSINPWFTVGLDIDIDAPEITITSHTDFDYVRETFTLRGTCSDNVAITKVLVSIKASDGDYNVSNLKAVIKNGIWSYTIETNGANVIPDGEYLFTVQAYDAEKNESFSSIKSVTLYIDNVPSAVTISYPLLRASVLAWDNTSDIYQPELADYYLNDNFYIQGSISEDFAVDSLHIRLTEVNINNEETPYYLDVTIDSTMKTTSNGTIADNILSIDKSKNDTVSIWSWKIWFQEDATRDDILTPRFYKITTVVTDAAGNIDPHMHGYICVLPQSDYPYILFNDYGEKIPVKTPLTGKACDDDGIAKVEIQLCNKQGIPLEDKIDTYTPLAESDNTTLGKFYNWKTENSVPIIGGEYLLRVTVTDINGLSNWAYYGDNQYIHPDIYREKDLLMMDLSAPSIDIQGLKGKVPVVSVNDKPLDFDEYGDIVDASGDFTLVCNASDASQVTKIYLAQLLSGVTEEEQNALTAIDPETSNIKWNIDWDDKDSVVIGHIHYFKLYEYNNGEIQAKLTKYLPLNVYTDFNNTYDKKTFYVYAENASEKTTVSYRAISIEPDKPEILIISPNAGATLTNVFSISAEITDFTGLKDITISAFQNNWQSGEAKLLTFNELQNDSSFSADTSGHNRIVTITDLPSTLFGQAETFVGGVCTLTVTATDLYGNTVSEKVQFYIDTDEPIIKNISAKPAIGTYKAGDIINLQMEISKEVSVSGGTPSLILALDNDLTIDADLTNDISDVSISPNILQFQYKVAADQNTQLLNCIGMNLNGAVIQDSQNYEVNTSTLPTDGIGSLKSNSAIRVDTISPTIASVKTLTPNGSYSTHSNIKTVEIQVIFSENVLISGTPRLKLNAINGSTPCYALYDGKNTDASNKALFVYTIKSGDTTNGAQLTWTEWDDNNSVITDTANSGRKDDNIFSGNPFAAPDNEFINSHQWSQKIYIDTESPTITDISLNNATNLAAVLFDNVYYCNEGRMINLAVTFSENVELSETPYLSFNEINSTATYVSGKGSNRLVFSYSVANNDNTANYLKVKSIVDTIKDNAGNPINTTLPNSGNIDKNIIIDTIKPQKPTVTITTAKNAVNASGTDIYTGLSNGKTIGVTLAANTDTSSYQYCWTENDISLGWETGNGSINKTFGSDKDEGFYQEYTITLQLRDKAGNLSDASNVKHFIIDTDKPKLTGISNSAIVNSSLVTSESGTYMTGEKIYISLEFNKSVKVSSELKIKLNNGKELIIANGTAAKHISGSSSYYLTAEYSVTTGNDIASDLDITQITAGSVKDDLNNTLTYTALNTALAGISKNLQEIKIDTTVPTINSITTDVTGCHTVGTIIPISVKFSEAVRYSGTQPTLTLNNKNKNGSAYNKATYISGSGTSEWMFSYEVKTGDKGYESTDGDSNTDLTTSNNLKVKSINDTITDMAGVSKSGNSLNTALPSENMKTNKVGIDTKEPAILNINATDSEGKSWQQFNYDSTTQTYTTGKTPVTVTVNQGESNALYYITKNGDPVYEWVSYNNISSIICSAEENEYLSYTIAARQKDPAGNISNESSVSFTIDNAAVKLESISTSHSSGTCTVGADIPITLKFNKKVKITQPITLTLNATRSGTPITLTPTPISTDTTFSNEKEVPYTVANGDTTPEVLNVTGISGKVIDNLNKELTLTTETLKEISNLAATKQITIDTAAPTLRYISTNGDGWYNAGKLIAITLTFNEDIKVGTTAPTLQLSSGGTAVYSSHSGENMTFIYTVGSNESTNSSRNLSVTESLGDITDQAGNKFTNITSSTAIKKASNTNTNAQIGIDTEIGSITVANITANPNIQINNKDDLGYLVSQTLRFSGISDSGSGLQSATYTKAGVTNNLTINGNTDIVCSAEDGTSAVFVFSATMTDNAENTASIEFTIKIDGTNISLDKISSDKANGTYTGGTNIPVTLTFSTPVKVTSLLTVTFNNGDTMTIPAAAANAEYSPTLIGKLTATKEKKDDPLTVTSISGIVQDSRGAEKQISSWADHITSLDSKTANLADSRSIYIDTTAPTLTSVSTAAADGWYKAGSHIYMTLTFDEDVKITGTPKLTLSSGGTAIYQSNSGPEVTFLYTVGSSDSTSGQTLKATGIVSNSGTITDTAKESGNVFDGSALSSKGLKKSDKTTAASVGIDNAITPIIIKNGNSVITNKSYTSDNNLKYYRSQTLTVSWNNENGAGSTATYTVNGENKGSIANGGTISCPLAEDAIASYLVIVTKTDTAGNTTSSNAEIQINGEEIKLLSITSTNANGTYVPNDEINLTLNFNKEVQLTQAASMTLNNGKTLTINTTNNYSSSISTTYTVASGEDTPNGENLAISSFSAGEVQDDRGADAARTLSELLSAADNLNVSKAIKIDTVKPTLTRTTTSADGWYKANDQIAVTLTFSEDVKVTGTPTITMSTNTTATYQTGSGTSNLMFVYKVSAGNTTGANKNLYISSLSGLSNKITDAAGNAYTPIASEYGTGKLMKASATSTAATVGIDTTAPTLTITNNTSGGTIADGNTINKAAAQTIKFELSDGSSSINTSKTTYVVNGTSNALTNGKSYTCAETAGTKNAYAITAMVTDNAGNTTTKSFTVIIDGTPIVLETITSSTSSGTYKSGVAVPITLTFNNPVKVTTALTLTFNNGDTLPIPTDSTLAATKTATYTTARQTAAALKVTSITGAIEDNRGTVKAITSTDQWTSVLSAANNLDASKSILIDTTAPSVSSVTTETVAGWYKAGTLIRIMLNCSETVKVTGTPTLTLNLTNGATTAEYISGSGTNTLTFAYTVGSNDSTGTSQNLSVKSISGTITDIAGNALSAISTTALSNSIGIDTGKPTTLTLSGITANATKYNANALTLSGFGDTGSGNASYTIIINGTSYKTDKTDTDNIEYSELPTAAKNALTVADGGKQTFTITAYQTDTAGNNSTESSSLTFTIDKNPAKITSVTSSKSNEIIKNGNTLDIVFNFSRPLTSVSSPTITLSNGVTGTLSKVTTTQYKYTYNVGTASTQDTSGAALKITNVSGSITDALTTQTLASLWSNNATYNISGYNVIVDTIAPTLNSGYPTASYSDSTGKATVTYKFSEKIEKVGGKKFTLTRTAYAAPIILTPAEYDEYYSQAPGIKPYYEKTINGWDNVNGKVDKTSKYVLKYEYDPTVSALVTLFNGIGYYKSEITIESTNVSISGDTLTVTIPKEQLMTGETYTVSADTGLIKDLVGNQCGTISAKTFTTGNKPQKPVIRVNKISGRGTTANYTTFKVDTVTSGATVNYGLGESGSFIANPTSAYSTTNYVQWRGTKYYGVKFGSTSEAYIYYLTAKATKSGTSSDIAYEKAFKTTLKTTPNYQGGYSAGEGTFYVFRGADVSSGSATVDNFPLSWDEKSIGSNTWNHGNTVGDTLEEKLAEYGMLLADGKKAITWGATEDIYFHGLTCKVDSNILKWAWQEGDAKHGYAGSSTNNEDTGKIERNYHDYDGNNY